jgi:hypothetical protein
MGGTTDHAFTILHDASRELFGLNPDDIRKAAIYIEYGTTTKIQFSKPLAPLFCKEMQELLAKWKNIDSRAVVDETGGQWPPTSSAFIHASPEYWEKYFGKGAPKEALVIPMDLEFRIYLPSRFYKMTSYGSAS